MFNTINQQRLKIRESQQETQPTSILYTELSDEDISSIVGGLYLKQEQSSHPFGGNDDDGDDDDDNVPDCLIWDIDTPN